MEFLHSFSLICPGWTRKAVARLVGIEPTTCGLEVRRSIQLSYRRDAYRHCITEL